MLYNVCCIRYVRYYRTLLAINFCLIYNRFFYSVVKVLARLAENIFLLGKFSIVNRLRFSNLSYLARIVPVLVIDMY